MIVLPKSQKIFLETKEVSSMHLFVINITWQNGRFHQFFRNSERRNSKNKKHIKNSNIEEVKEEIYIKHQLIEDLKEKVDKFEEVCLKNDKNSEILSKLLDKGIIDGNEELIEKRLRRACCLQERGRKTK